MPIDELSEELYQEKTIKIQHSMRFYLTAGLSNNWFVQLEQNSIYATRASWQDVAFSLMGLTYQCNPIHWNFHRRWWGNYQGWHANYQNWRAISEASEATNGANSGDNHASGTPKLCFPTSTTEVKATHHSDTQCSTVHWNHNLNMEHSCRNNSSERTIWATPAFL